MLLRFIYKPAANIDGKFTRLFVQSPVSDSSDRVREVIVMDIVYLILMVLFFAVTVALVYGCEKLRGHS